MHSTNALQQFLLFFIIATITAQNNNADSNGDPDWSYENSKAWGENYPDCNGFRQSPIYINSKTAISSSSPSLGFQNFDVPLKGPLTVTNIGYTVNIDTSITINGKKPSITCPKTKKTYEAVGIHFHWGSTERKGADHIIDGKRYDGELHIVHRNIEYEDDAEALKHPDGLAVLGIFIAKDDQAPNNYPGLYKILKTLPEIVELKSKVVLTDGFSLNNLLGNLNTEEFYTYEGSLTTPPCSESITWHVFPDVVRIRASYINNFFNLKGYNNSSLINNFRPVQDINGRKVYYRSNVLSGPKPKTVPKTPRRGLLNRFLGLIRG